MTGCCAAKAGGDVTREAELMRYVHEHGYPVPVVYDADGPDLVLERLDGPTLLTALGDGSVGLADGARVLADLLQQLHRIPEPDGPAAVLHLDLHPDNVIMTAAGPVVIDWRNATTGPGLLDVAMTTVIIAQTALDPDEPVMARLAGAALGPVLAEVPDPQPALDEAIARRAADPNLSPAERDRLAGVSALVRRSRG
jgi:aminoglycoside phosphotransferase (APT) family kinase protein